MPYFALYLKAIGASAGQIAFVLAMPQLARVFAPGFWGAFADRRGAHRGVAVFGAASLVAGYALLFLVRAPAGIAAIMLVMSVLAAGALPVVESLAMSTLGATSGRYGPVRMWGSLSFVVAVLAAGAWLDRHRVEAVLWPIWLLAIATLAVACALPRGAPAREAGGAAPLGGVLRRPEVAALLAACFFMTVAHGALYAFFSIYLDRLGYSKTAIGVLWTLGVLAEIVVFLLLPQLMHRVSLRRLLLAAFALAALRFAAIGWGAQWLAVLVAAQLLHAASFGVYHAASLAAVHRLFPPGSQARGQAVVASLSTGLGGMAGTLLAGWSWTALGAGASFTLSALAALAGAALVAARVRLA